MSFARMPYNAQFEYGSEVDAGFSINLSILIQCEL